MWVTILLGCKMVNGHVLQVSFNDWCFDRDCLEYLELKKTENKRIPLSSFPFQVFSVSNVCFNCNFWPQDVVGSFPFWCFQGIPSVQPLGSLRRYWARLNKSKHLMSVTGQNNSSLKTKSAVFPCNKGPGFYTGNVGCVFKTHEAR